MSYYDPRNPKIDVYANGVYQFTTKWFKTCRDALAYYSEPEYFRGQCKTLGVESVKLTAKRDNRKGKMV